MVGVPTVTGVETLTADDTDQTSPVGNSPESHCDDGENGRPRFIGPPLYTGDPNEDFVVEDGCGVYG